MTYFQLSPLLRSRFGLDAFNDIFNHINVDTPNYPFYNIEKFDDNRYAIVLNVAGFSDEDLDIELEGNVLKISATSRETLADTSENADEDASEDASEDEMQYLYEGFVKRAFTRQFNVTDHVNIVGAELENGLLTITLERNIPEALKPRKIAISSGDSGAQKIKAS
ncbi:MAG: Hsp20 family protein [Alphaproteobacteria bacterium]|nr:Hsp20 family protein [Alphaproteobacteria bacterium]